MVISPRSWYCAISLFLFMQNYFTGKTLDFEKVWFGIGSCLSIIKISMRPPLILCIPLWQDPCKFVFRNRVYFQLPVTGLWHLSNSSFPLTLECILHLCCDFVEMDAFSNYCFSVVFAMLGNDFLLQWFFTNHRKLFMIFSSAVGTYIVGFFNIKSLEGVILLVLTVMFLIYFRAWQSLLKSLNCQVLKTLAFL